MPNALILSRLDTYNCKTAQEREMALKEITQEMILWSLSRTGFFGRAAFQGGTCLRIVYGLQRFSEDLDFVLKAPDASLTLDRELSAVKSDLAQYGYDVQVRDNSGVGSAVKSASIKDSSLTKMLSVRNSGGQFSQLTIKLEVDSNPPEGSGFETKTLLWPLGFSITLQDVPSLFSGKIHALLCRKYTKGRDVFDLLWYLARRSQPNLRLLGAALRQAGPWMGKTVSINHDWVADQLVQKIEKADFDAIQADVRRFLRPQDQQALLVLTPDTVVRTIRQYFADVKETALCPSANNRKFSKLHSRTYYCVNGSACKNPKGRPTKLRARNGICSYCSRKPD